MENIVEETLQDPVYLKLDEIAESLRHMQTSHSKLDKTVTELLIWKSSMKRYLKYRDPIINQSNSSKLELRICLILAFICATPLWRFILDEHWVKLVTGCGYLVLCIGAYYSVYS